MTATPNEITPTTDAGTASAPTTAVTINDADHVTPRVGVQRDALTRLSDEVARRTRDTASAREAHEQRLAWLESRRRETADRAQRRHKARSKAAKAAANDELAAHKKHHDADRRRFELDAKKQREAIADETRDQQKKVTADLEYERWTAGSIFEGTVGKLKHRLKTHEKSSADAGQHVQVLTVRAQQTLLLYRMPELANTLADLPEAAQSSESGKPAKPEQPSHKKRSEATQTDAAPATPSTSDDTAEREALVQPDYPDAFDPEQPMAWHEQSARRYADAVKRLGRMPLPRLFVGGLPWVLATVFVIVGAFAGLALPAQYGDTELPPPVRIMIAGCVALFLVIGLWWLFFRLAQGRVKHAVAELRELKEQSHDALDAFDQWAQYEQSQRIAEARAQRDQALNAAESKLSPVIDDLRQRRRAKLDALDADLSAKRGAMDRQLDTDADAVRTRIKDELEQRKARAKRRTEITQQRFDRDTAAAQAELETRLAEIDRHWTRQRDDALQTLADIENQARRDAPDWADDAWPAWTPPSQPAALAPFGTMRCEPRHLLDGVDPEPLGLPQSLELTAALSTPGPRSWLIESEPDDRPVALAALRGLILRLLTTQPPGRVRTTLLDPVGLGESFAALMHLADHDEQLVNSRAWSEPAQMEQRLVDLTDHMAVVIQKYLRNDFETIEAYNAQAGELAEPYRFLVMADFPHGLSEDGLARLSSIASSGARCGVFVLLLRDPRKPLLGAVNDDLQRHCVTVKRERLNPGDPAGWRIQDEVFGHFPLTLDQAPDDARYTSLIQRIGAAAVDAERVQVPFTSITPPPPQRWTADSAEDLSVPIGRTGATRLQKFTLGHGVEQHALIAGKTGSGKSSLLHALVTNLALWYPPDQLELYLIDFKKGVEFKPYVTQRLPHARAIAIESDRAFGLSILRELDRLMDRRGETFRDAGVQVLAQYRKARPDEPMPRVLLVVDEFQELFSRDDQISQDAALLLDRLVRQGRAFGVHALMGSQSLSGAAGLARGTMGQMAVRIALQCNEADSQLILNDENSAARLLSRPGEAIYNGRGGDLEGNSVFQVAWLPDEEHVDALRTVDTLRQKRGLEPLPRAVFEGSAPALLSENADLHRLLAAPPESPRTPLAFVGEPIAIEAPTAVRLPREPGAHALIVGGSADAALPLVTSSILSLAAQHAADRAGFLLLNGSSEPEHDDRFQLLADGLPHTLNLASPRDAADRVVDLHAEMKRRLDEDDFKSPAVYAFVFGLQRFRDLRKQEDSFSFSSLDEDDGPKKTAPDKALSELLRDGPALGIHLIAWADRAASVESVFDRRDLREIDSRLLFQMSANDSAQLIDSTDANDLGGFRALLQREDRGTMTRFRPYGPIDPAWVKNACERLRKRS